MLSIVAAAILVKILMGIYTWRRGKRYESLALMSAGKDALNDAFASAATLGAALHYLGTGTNVEAYVGLSISALILKNGFETLRDTTSSLLGEPVDITLAAAVKQSILSFPEVEDVFDLIIHNYSTFSVSTFILSGAVNPLRVHRAFFCC